MSDLYGSCVAVRGLGVKCVICSLLLGLIIGCNSDQAISPVSGMVTMDGKPLSGVEVVFAPIGSEDNPNPGPASMGVTDESGKYSLKVRGNEQLGAVVGDHRVSIDFPEVSDSEIQDAIDKRVQDANSRGVDISPAEIDRISEATRKRLQVNPRLPSSYNDETILQFTVPKAGVEIANIDLKSDGS